MKEQEVLDLLEQTAARLSIELSYDDLKKGEINTPGGSFTLKGKRHILIHRHLSAKEKVEVLSELLSGMDTEGIHLPPDVRKRLDAVRLLPKKHFPEPKPEEAVINTDNTEAVNTEIDG